MHTATKRVLLSMVLALLVLGLAAAIAVWTGIAERWMQGAVVTQLTNMTGGRVELKRFEFRWFGLRAQLTDLTIHGLEPAGTAPLFHAAAVVVDLRVESFLRRRIALDELRVEQPAVHVRVEGDGRTNVPAPKRQARPGAWRERLFELAIRHLELREGEMLFNDVRVPLVAEGGPFVLTLDYNAGAGQPFYAGRFRWQQVMLAARRYIPFPSDVAAKFTLERDAFELNQLTWKLPQSNVDAEARLLSFAHPAWSFRYRGRLSLEDFRTILRKPLTPTGNVDFSGEGRYAGQLSIRGHYSTEDIGMRYQWFHAAGIRSRGSYQGDGQRIEVPDFEAQLLGGAVQGRVEVVLHGLKFRAETRAHGMSLAAILNAVDNPSFPVATLHWNAGVDTSAVTTWNEDFKQVDSRGVSLWGPAAELRAGEIPASGRIEFHYVMDRSAVWISEGTGAQPSEISTPESHLTMGGMLGKRDSALESRFEARDLLPLDDLINAIRGAPRGRAAPERIAGSGSWQGRVTGPLAGPTFTGHAHGFRASYGALYWDEVEGDIVYSPSEFRLTRGRARRGRAVAQLELALELDHWSFAPDSRWSFEANLDRADTNDLQALLGWTYPARGLLSGQFHGRGTRAEPELAGLFDLVEAEGWGFRFERARGQLNLSREEIRIANAELRIPPPNGAPATRAGGVVTGNFSYRRSDQQVSFDLTGAVVPLESIERIQTAALPLGGQLSFHVTGKGPLRAPASQGTLRLVDLRVGREVLGSFEGRLTADGRNVHLGVNSAMATGRLQGKLDVTLGGQYPIHGDLTLEGLDLDPFIQTALHLRALTGHSRVDGQFGLSAALAEPGTLVVEANLSRLSFDYESVRLENVGPVRLTYRRDEVRVEQAHLRGPDSDFTLFGFARFAGDRRLSLNVAGTVNLRLLGGWVPDLEARGPARVNAAIAGTFSQPLITGKVRVENATAHYGNIPAGLSQVTGDLVFDSSRLLLENVTAETGGGQLTLGGLVTYGDGPVRYDLTARAQRVRIRYPEGMSWLAGGNLRFTGSLQGAVLSGRVVVERLFMAQGFDLASLILAAKEPLRAPSTTSPYLRNLQFDIEAASSPDARVEWTGARFESEASLRVRGTWEHPILLGHVHLLSGEMTFRGNRYRLTRGELNFSNPFRLDPVLNVEAATTIRQYEVTLNFTGPASRLTLAYRSDPPLPASDIIALLALGRTSEESELRSPTALQTPELGATMLLSEAISSQLGGRIERLFGFSRFRVDPFLAGTGTEQNAAARITVEQQLTRGLVITYITNVTSTQQQVIQVEYNVSRSLSIIALRDQNGTFGLDVKLKKRFK